MKLQAFWNQCSTDSVASALILETILSILEVVWYDIKYSGIPAVQWRQRITTDPHSEVSTTQHCIFLIQSEASNFKCDLTSLNSQNLGIKLFAKSGSIQCTPWKISCNSHKLGCCWLSFITKHLEANVEINDFCASLVMHFWWRQTSMSNLKFVGSGNGSGRGCSTISQASSLIIIGSFDTSSIEFFWRDVTLSLVWCLFFHQCNQNRKSSPCFSWQLFHC